MEEGFAVESAVQSGVIGFGLSFYFFAVAVLIFLSPSSVAANGDWRRTVLIRI